MGHTSDAAGPGPAAGRTLLDDPSATVRSDGTEVPVSGSHAPRKDIQALRALAVAMVVVYHFWPAALPGGFIGVDVFFVISGFLITGALFRRPPRNLGRLTQFWARRVLRLVPAVTVTLLVSLAAIASFLPLIEWQSGARHAWTSMLYVENWRLVADATDYLRAEGTASPFQHFWSLSVEEQFYLGWPLLVGLVAVLAARCRWSLRTALGVAIAAVTAFSFAYNLSLSWSEPSLAYFSTLTRIWELGLGGILAVWVVSSQRDRHSPVAALLAWVAVAGMLASALLLDKTSVFPGWNALFPTVCAALFILAGDPVGRFSPRPLTHARGVQLVGDTSYAIYLWHWPVLLLVPLCLGLETSTWLKVLLLPCVLALSWLSTTFVEDPLRPAPHATGVRRRSALVLVLCSGLVVGLCALMTWWVDRAAADSERRLAALSSGVVEPTCVGAGAYDPDLDCPPTRDLVTTPEFSSGDIPPSIKVGECLNWPPFSEPVTCQLGATDEPVRRVALYGNSHAGHWQPALEAIATVRRWQVDTYVVGVCQPTLDNVSMPGVMATEQANCDVLQEKVQNELTSLDYDLVVMSTMDHESTDVDVYEDTLTRLTEAEVPVLVIRDTPAPADPDNPPPVCVSRHLDDLDACAGSPGSWIRQDPLHEAAEELDDPLVSTVDLNDRLCTEDRCPLVIGGVIVYADFNHMSATFNRSLAPYLEPYLVRAMGAEDDALLTPR
ncbi:acyltransferase family protein [Nocardioides sp. 616]|uniref:acyltransferase family protein n=1 Tax=Nocardioides sp. 616 TaxID=2268090 RepID=UPI000CE40E88|nr:acyltransferase family protein [Nocardioides sp. 616]